MSFKLWLKGLIAAIVGGVAGAVGVMIADPMTFNLGVGLSKLGNVCIVMAIVSAAMYLKQSPLPNGGQK